MWTDQFNLSCSSHSKGRFLTKEFAMSEQLVGINTTTTNNNNNHRCCN